MHTTLLWQRLEQQLLRQIDEFPGIAGIAIKELRSGKTIAIHGDELFPTASTIKIHILIQLLVMAEAGEVDLMQPITLHPTMHVGGSGVLSYLDCKVELALIDIANLMIIASDNTATNICLELTGIEPVNKLLRKLGLNQTVLRRKMMDELAAVTEKENVSTPAELVKILELLHNGKPSPDVAEQCIEMLKKPKHGFIDKVIPGDVECANKPGWVEEAMCDAAIVFLPRCPYSVAIMTKYALCDPVQQENFIVSCAQTIHETLSALDRSNQFGRGVYV